MELGIGMFGDLGIHSASAEIKSAHQRLSEMIEEIKLGDQI